MTESTAVTSASSVNINGRNFMLMDRNHPGRAHFCQQFASSLRTRYASSGDRNLLIPLITLHRELVSLHPKGHPEHASACQNLAISLKMRCAHTGDDELLSEAIELEQESLALHPTGHPDRAISCANLAASFCMRFEYMGDDEAIIRATELQQEAVSLCPTGHNERPKYLSYLALIYHMRHKRDGNVDFLGKALEIEREVLSLYSDEHPAHAKACVTLATTLYEQYQQIGDNAMLAEAITLQRVTLSSRPVGHPDHAAARSTLAKYLRTRFARIGNDVDLAELIALERDILAEIPADQPNHDETSASLAVLLKKRYRMTGDDDLLTEAIQLERRVLSHRSLGHVDRALACGDLAVSLKTRYRRINNDDLLTEAIGLEREALALRPIGHPDRALSCGNLAVSLKMRYKRVSDDDLLTEIIDLERESLALRPMETRDRAASCANFAVSLKLRFRQTYDRTHLVEAIELEREALTLAPTGHPNRGDYLTNLADSLRSLFDMVRDVQLLRESIQFHRDALALRPIGHPDRAVSCGNLALNILIYHHEAIKLEDDHNFLEEAIPLLTEAYETAPTYRRWLFGTSLSELYSFVDTDAAIKCLDSSLTHDIDDPAGAVHSALISIDCIYKRAGGPYHKQLVPVYKRVVYLMSLLVNPALASQTQLKRLGKFTHLGPDAFINAIMAGQYEMGLELLEVVQGVFWSQRLYRRDPQMQDVPVELANSLEEVLRAISSSSSEQADPAGETWFTSRDAVHNSSARLYALVREIRGVPGLERFMLGETFETLLTVGSPLHPVVVLAEARGRYYALIITSSDLQSNSVLELPIEEQELYRFSHARSLMRIRGAVQPENADTEHEERGLRLTRTTTLLSHHLRCLWIKIVKPVLDKIGVESSNGRSRRRLHWCPTGLFNSLPLHAAGIYEGMQNERTCCADYVVSAYTPTLTTLLRARRAMSSLPRHSTALMLVAERKAQDPSLPVIPGVDSEIKEIVAVVHANSIPVIRDQTGSTRIADISEAMKSANMIHLACHGVQDNSDATQSGFCLSDGRLTISHLMDLHLKDGFLAFLSACETAMGSREQPDQAMHLAAAMLFTGFKSVVATMWAITDADGPKVAKWFYEALFANEVINADAVAYALDEAVGKLRESGVPAERWVPFIHMGA